MNDKLTLAQLLKTDFEDLYKQLLLEDDCSLDVYQTLLSLSVLLLNANEDSSSLAKLAYRILVLYSNKTNNYEPLYEISLNMGLFPITKHIERLRQYKQLNNSYENVFSELNSSFLELYKDGHRYNTYEQQELINFFEEKSNNSVVAIAPTSYGKTDLIIKLLSSNRTGNLCVITPSKSLLNQTKKRISDSNIDRVKKIIVHPDMYNSNKDNNITCVLTQERLYRLLNKNKTLKFDYVIVDEAHNLLEDQERFYLTSSVIMILYKRNDKTAFKFLTPFLVEPSSLNLRFTEIDKLSYKVTESLKSELFFLYDIQNNILEQYDQFTNKFYSISNSNSCDEKFIIDNSASKNIIYINSPKTIEKFASNFSNELNDKSDPRLISACNDIAEYIHEDYNLIQYLKKGFIYHHGSIPDFIRPYIEELYSTIDDIKYVITSSTLLEGVNLPIDRMFIIDHYKGGKRLSISSFRNLIGRVSRFSEIFDINNRNLNKLTPKIYIIKGNYCRAKANMRKFLQEVANIEKKPIDVIENILLSSADCKNEQDLVRLYNLIENTEDGVIKNNGNIRKAITKIGQSCFHNGVTEIDILNNEEIFEHKLDSVKSKHTQINGPYELIEILHEIFIESFSLKNDQLKRLNELPARKFYSMLLAWRINGATYKEMVNNFLSYWKLPTTNKLIYVGSKWGEETRAGKIPLWVNIENKTNIQRTNLAIVRIKEEQDFIDHTLVKYIEVLNDMNLLNVDFYHKVKYGTSDIEKIILVKNGFSSGLIKLLFQKYRAYFTVNINDETLSFNDGIISTMEKCGENGILINEIKYYL